MLEPSITVQLNSETGRLKTVLLHRPGSEVEAMTPANAGEALYSDILNGTVADEEYSFFEGALKRVAKVFYVTDLLAEVLADATVRGQLVRESCRMDGCDILCDELMQLPADRLAKALVEGFRYRPGRDPKPYEGQRYLLKPLYNLFFTRDACSFFRGGALINSMSFPVRRRETLIYKAICEHRLGVPTYWAEHDDSAARTEGGDVQIVRDDLLCLGNGIRTNKEGIASLLRHYGAGRDRFTVISQELPQAPDSFIHLDMVFTFLGPHACMAYQPLLDKRGLFAGKHTVLHRMEGGKTTHQEYPNLLAALKTQGVELQPVLCGGGDDWQADREQWHSGANFFSFGENHILGYRRNRHTIEALDKAGFAVLNAEEVAAGTVDPWRYDKAVVTFAASELPRGGGGARCMTCPVQRDETSWE